MRIPLWAVYAIGLGTGIGISFASGNLLDPPERIGLLIVGVVGLLFGVLTVVRSSLFIEFETNSPSNNRSKTEKNE